MAIFLDGTTYPSQAAAGLALGVSRQAISSRLARLSRGLRRRGASARVFLLDGIRATATEHAARTGLTVSAVYRRAKRVGAP